jgi:hypothetical protein
MVAVDVCRSEDSFECLALVFSLNNVSDNVDRKVGCLKYRLNDKEQKVDGTEALLEDKDGYCIIFSTRTLESRHETMYMMPQSPCGVFSA